MTRLSVNLNKVALLRNSRTTGVPSVLHFAKLAHEAGVHGLTIHPRPDERHIRTHDVYDLAEWMKPYRPQGFELNIEGRPDARLLKLIEDVRPEQVTLVPDAPNAFTSFKGWDATAEETAFLQSYIPRIKATGARLILFIDPNPAVPQAVKNIEGVNGVEIYTGAYAESVRLDADATALDNVVKTHNAAQHLGLVINAGHDLNLVNLPPLMAHTQFFECSIGHELTADALEMGWKQCLKAYKEALS